MRVSRCMPAVAIAAACLFATASERSAGASADDFFTHLHTDKAMANVTISPARVGPVKLAIQLETVDELPLKAKSVRVMLSKNEAKSALGGVDAVWSGSDKQWLASMTVPSSGRWTLALDIAISDGNSVKIEAPIVIQ